MFVKAQWREWVSQWQLGCVVQLICILSDQETEGGTRNRHYSQDLPTATHFYQLGHMTLRLHSPPKLCHQPGTTVSLQTAWVCRRLKPYSSHTFKKMNWVYRTWTLVVRERAMATSTDCKISSISVLPVSLFPYKPAPLKRESPFMVTQALLHRCHPCSLKGFLTHLI